MSSLRKAQNLIEAADGRMPTAEAPVELASLLNAVEMLVESAPAPEKPDAAFASGLRANLLARYDVLVEGEEVPKKASARRRAIRWAWIAAPAFAAAAALVLLLVFGVFKAPAPPAVATLTMSVGKATVVEPDGKSHVVKDVGDISLDQTVRVSPSSRAVMDFKNGNIARLEAGTVARVDGYGDRSVALELTAGKVYNRVVNDTRYKVVHSGVTVSALGTAFDVEAVGRGIVTNAFESSVKVTWTGATTPLDVGQGSQALVIPKDGGFEGQVRPIDLTSLDFSWLAYNRDLDHKAGFPLGILENLAPTPPQGVQPPAVALPPGQTAPTTPQAAPTTTPGSTPVTQPTTPQGPPSATVSVASQGPPVVIKWQGSNVESADSVAVQRSPGGTLAVYTPGQADSFSDATAEGGATYTYWVEYMRGGQVLTKSNAVTVTVPAPEPPPPPPATLQVSLDGNASASVMELKWGSTGSPLPETWVVLRSEGGSPSYPGSTYAELRGGSAGGSFTDPKIDPTRRYTWRIAAVSGGRVITYSNTVSNI